MTKDWNIMRWMFSHKLKALEKAFERQGLTVPNVLGEHLMDLYESQVPVDERDKIEEQIQAEKDEFSRYYNPNRRIALLEVIENGMSRYFESVDCYSLFDVTSRFINALETQKIMEKQFQGMFTQQAFGDCLETDPAYMQDYTSHRSYDTRVVFCAKVNCDQKTIEDWEMGFWGWVEYDYEQLSYAFRSAMREPNLTPSEREEFFEVKLYEDNPEFDEDEDCEVGMRS